MDKYAYLYDSEVRVLFNDYGKRHGISSSNIHVHRIENCSGPDKSPARFEAHVRTCYDFQTYLLHFGKRMSNDYDWKMIHVKCNILHFSLCLAHVCPPEDFIALGYCAYNTTTDEARNE
ncbi:unnamed protein product [Cylicocyclus nassatus]|uniref:Uncharacterized protein n=1 Tax=Cylicocyclus nassatus TaxID=53992 RepID=A0AA36GRV3_CYLNA|nr:unnamed protein product [Cylicocyclus nassatus]